MKFYIKVKNIDKTKEILGKYPLMYTALINFTRDMTTYSDSCLVEGVFLDSNLSMKEVTKLERKLKKEINKL